MALARSNDAHFRIMSRFGIELLYRCSDGGEPLQLVLPATHGLRRTLMQELHCTPTGAHFGSKMLMALLLQRVWWPRMR